MAIPVLTLGACGEKKNPLLVTSTAPYEAPLFPQITNEDYKPAFDKALEEARADIDRIVNNPDEPTFANTVEALAFSGERLDNVSSVFFNLNEANTNDTMQNLALEISPVLTEFSNDITLNPALFERVKAVYARRDSLALTPEQSRLLEKTYKDFARNGAALSETDKKTYRELTAKLSQLTQKFNQNTLGATNAFILHITDSAQVAELPDFVREGAAAEAKERNLEGWVVTLQYPSMSPFMMYSSNRELKEKLWKAYNTRAFGGEFDNSKIVEEIADTRLQVARLLGYDTYADYVLEERMAESAPTVNAFLTELLDRAIGAAHADVKSVAEYAAANGFTGELMPWDFSYYSEKLKNEKYSINEELTKPYFKLENVQAGIFDLAGRLYGISFKENPDIPVYHPDVKAYEVHDADGKFLAVLYMDFFPRASKRGGAWMTEFRSQSARDGQDTRPLVSLVFNFTKPTENTPSLLTFDEVSTMLHEFGHSLHGILSQGNYPGMTGTAVADYGELGYRERVPRPLGRTLPDRRKDAGRADPADHRRQELPGRLPAYPPGIVRFVRHGLAQHYRPRERTGRRFRSEGSRQGPGDAAGGRTVHVDLVHAHLRRRLCRRVLQLQMGRSARSGRVLAVQGKRHFRPGDGRVVPRKHPVERQLGAPDGAVRPFPRT